MGIIIFILILVAIFLLHFGGRDAPFVGVEVGAVKRILDLAEVGEGDIVYDLGSGDGRVVIAAALRGARAYGVEINIIRVWYSRMLIRMLRLQDRATIIHGNIFREDLSDATVVVSYLLEEAHLRLKWKLVRELSDSTRLVAVAFKYPGWREMGINLKGTQYGPLRLYIMPPYHQEHYL